MLDRLADLAQRDPSGRAASLLDGSLPEAVRKRLSAEIVRSDFAAEEARRRYPAAVRELRIRAKKRQIESLQAEIREERDRERQESLFACLLAATKEKERLESERRSR